MSTIKIIEARTRKDRKAFVAFPMKLYSGCGYYVPPLIADELQTLSPEKNPAFERAEAKLFLAVKDADVVGRIAGIISHAANEEHKTKNLRFGWFDCVNDHRVAAALFDAVENWGRERGMETLTGPQGFDGFDKAGMLTEGYEKLPTMATYYNYPYYNDFVVQHGFAKEVDFVEYRVLNLCKDEFPPRLSMLAEKLKRRKGYRVLEFSNKKEMLGRAQELFELLQDSYADLHGYTPITEKQRAYYIKKFFPFLHEKLLKAVVNEQGEMIGFLVAIPSLSVGLQRANGRLFPFGFIHLWKALKNGNKVLDFVLGGVKKEYRGRGVDLIMAAEMHRSIAELGFEHAETNPELEMNIRVRSEWKPFEHVLHKRRRLYKKSIKPKNAASVSLDNYRQDYQETDTQLSVVNK